MRCNRGKKRGALILLLGSSQLNIDKQHRSYWYQRHPPTFERSHLPYTYLKTLDPLTQATLNTPSVLRQTTTALWNLTKQGAAVGANSFLLLVCEPRHPPVRNLCTHLMFLLVSAKAYRDHEFLEKLARLFFWLYLVHTKKILIKN